MFFGYSYYLENTQQNTNIYACAPITTRVANQSAFLLNSIGYKANVKQHPDELSIMLSINNVYIARVVEGCNAISIIILFIAFIVAFSSKITTTALYILFGSLLIYIVNIIRIAFITVALYKYPEYQKILHDIVFPSIIYGITFLLWFIWVTYFSKLKK